MRGVTILDRPFGEWERVPYRSASGHFFVAHHVPRYCEVRVCQLCGGRGGSHQVGDFPMEIYAARQPIIDLGRYAHMRCWNRLRPLIKRAEDAAELMAICRRMLKTLPELYNAIGDGNVRPEIEN